jgi:hypothetical protein
MEDPFPQEIWAEIMHWLVKLNPFSLPSLLTTVGLVSSGWRTLLLRAITAIQLDLTYPTSIRALDFYLTHCPFLQRLEFTGPRDYNFFSLFSSTGQRRFPSTLSHLAIFTINILFNDLDPLLPPTLKNLVLTSVVTNSETCFDHLPTSLRRLVLIESPIERNKLSLLTRTPIPPLINTRFPQINKVQLPNLEILRVPTIIDEAQLVTFPSSVCPNLRHLDISDCEHISERGIASIVSGPWASTLRSLDISFCGHLTQTSAFSALEQLCFLTLLDLSFCDGFTDDMLEYVPASVHSLFLSHCTQLTGYGFQYLRPGIKVLDIYGCDKLRPVDSFAALPEFLEKLYMGSEKVTDESVKALKCTATLHTLDLTFSSITSAGLEYICKAFSNLKDLRLSGCTFDDETLHQLPRSLTNLDLSASDNILDSTVTHIPHFVSSIVLWDCSLTGKCFSQLSGELKSLDLSPGDQIPIVSFEWLPKSLEILHIHEAPRDVFAKARKCLPETQICTSLSFCPDNYERI